MTLFTAVRAVWRILVIVQFANVGLAQTNYEQSEVSGGGKPEKTNIGNVMMGSRAFVGLYYPFNILNQLDATSYQPQQNSPPFTYANINPESPLNKLYRSNNMEISPIFSAAAFNPNAYMQQIYQQALLPRQPQIQQALEIHQFQQIPRQFSPTFGSYQHPAAFRVSQQVPPWAVDGGQQLYSFPQSPQQPQYPLLNNYPLTNELPQYQYPSQYPILRAPQSEEFYWEYGNSNSVLTVQKVLGNADKLIKAIRLIERPLPAAARFHLFQLAARLLSRMSSLEVVLISQRNNSDKDKQIDASLHSMEDKSYQLRMLLIELQSLAAKGIPVATQPGEIPPFEASREGFPLVRGYPD